MSCPVHPMRIFTTKPILSGARDEQNRQLSVNAITF